MKRLLLSLLFAGVRRRAACARRSRLPLLPGRAAGPPHRGVHAGRRRARDAPVRQARPAAHEKRHAAHDVDTRRRARPRGQLPREPISAEAARASCCSPALLSVVGERRGAGESFRPVLNVKALLRETSGLPAFEELRIGRLPVPNWLADWGLARAMQSLDRTDQYHGRRRYDPQREHRRRQRADRLRMARRSAGAREQGAAAAGGQRALQGLPGAASAVDAASRGWRAASR